MLAEFDVIIVGAGPAAAGALIGREQLGRLCVITGAWPGIGVSRKDVHPKIRAVAEAWQEVPGVTDPIAIAGSAHPTFSTAITGGLANYWGQQFVRYGDAEPWPRGVFDRYEDYLAACARIEAEFHLDESNGPLAPHDAGVGAYRARSPRLLIGTTHEPGAGLLSMRRLVEQKLIESGATKIDARVESLESIQGCWGAKLSNGGTVSAKRILIAAGVQGTAALLMRSFPEINSVRLQDHAPVMLYTRGLDRIIRTTRSGVDPHFNVQTLQRDTEEGTALFATVYNMRYAELNLLLALLGRPVAGLAGWRAPWPAGWIKPIQVWTKSMITAVEIDRGRSTATVVDRPRGHDEELATFVNTLRDHGVTVLKISETPPLQGFHYHGLEVRADDQERVPVELYLARRSGRNVRCVDASVLPDIGCRPHTQTVMAAALRLAMDIDRPAPALFASGGFPSIRD